MKIIYQLKLEDLILFHNKFLKENSFLFKWHVFLIALAIAIGYTLQSGPILELYKIENDVKGTIRFNVFIEILLNFTGYSLLIFLIRFIIKDRFRNETRQIPTAFGNRELEWSEKYIMTTSETGTNSYLLNVFKKIEDYKGFYCLYIDKFPALIIPKSALSSSEIIGIILKESKLELKVCK